MTAVTEAAAERRIRGWWFYDWASQPYATLLLTFIFAPYVKDLLGDGSAAQAAWGYGVGAAGLVVALLAPALGAVADRSGYRMRWIVLFSVLYVIGAAGLWCADPTGFSLPLVLCFFGLGLVGMEFSAIFVNAMLPELGPRAELGRISGSGWAFGYVGGLIALVITLAFLAENETGRTLIGQPPVFGLDPATREGTRAVGPFVAIWYAVSMIPFFLWLRLPRRPRTATVGRALAEALPELGRTLRRLPSTPSLLAYLMSSMFYRDALNGMYVFGGIYAAGVLGWSVVDVGVFGILAVIAAAAFAWLGGRADRRFGPKPVIAVCLVTLIAAAVLAISISREAVLWLPVAPGSALPDIAYYAVGAIIGAAGGAMQSASRTMMVRQANPARMTESFGLYALSGKATSFLAPMSIGLVTDLSGSQPAGIVPLVVLFLLGLGLLGFVRAEGERTERWHAP
ncbi:MFS transporter [Rhodovulum sulfidophilum]|uniref:MFS transporter n=2 Tax=Rhodovulum sulfidophilum TaxID=35806 RepID=A0ABS1RQ28_RHOSU|nr:MFS transporter [Rhodovulum sulfidophilum]MBL3595544.1 MFS transporter [Rhodovulum sulfidophilum]MBL3608177.1 MFS transporter [Rhodovulum sulfidophilum]MCE8458534.1 MFS transporter [Rhodovulum sulfidophilum]